MSIQGLSQAYKDVNAYSTKSIAVTVEIDGLSTILTSAQIYKRVRYGDPDFIYGDPALVYGGLYPISGVKSILSLEGSSLTVSQQIEPEQGRGSISQLTLAFIDQDQFMTQLISPGIILSEILGRQVRVRLGFQEIAYPEEFFTIFRGRISNVSSESGRVVLQLSDPNIVRRQTVFYQPKTSLSSSIDAVTTTILVNNNGEFYQYVLGPNGAYDSNIKYYIKIDDEIIYYHTGGFGSNSFTGVTRGARGTISAIHTANAEVTQCCELSGHGIDIALKLMLSGLGGPYLTNVSMQSINFTGDPILGTQSNAIILPSKKNANDDYGLVAGDYITISGNSIPANNNTFIVQRFATLFDQPNRIIYVNGPLTTEATATGVMSFRSQYDVYNDEVGLSMTPQEVDVQGHLDIKSVWLTGSENSYRFFITSEQTLKSFLESEIYLPMAAYSLTRRGRLSMGVTRPPIADQGLLFLDSSNIINPINIKPARGLNTRKFFNRVDFSYDADDSGSFTNILRTLDSDSLNEIGIESKLPINTLGSRSDLGFLAVAQRRTRFLLQRYSRGAVMLSMQVNYAAANVIEAGDIVAIKDVGDLNITNFQTGERTLGTQLFEVINRSLNIGNGQGQLTLLGGVSSQAVDKYATWAPSSLIDYTVSSNQIMIKDSFGAATGTEGDKWKDYVGQKITVRSMDWAHVQTTTLVAQDSIIPYLLTVSDTLAPTPVNGWVIEVPAYPNNTDATDSQIYKVIHCFWNAQINITGGISQTQFTVSSGDALKIVKGNPVYIHNANYSITSFAVEAVVTDITGTTITVNKSLGFTPSSGQKLELIGYPDGGQPYRYV